VRLQEKGLGADQLQPKEKTAVNIVIFNENTRYKMKLPAENILKKYVAYTCIGHRVVCTEDQNVL
jgi:hypothetical protein